MHRPWRCSRPQCIPGMVPLQAQSCAGLLVCILLAAGVHRHAHPHVGQEVAAAACCPPHLGACVAICSSASISRQAHHGSVMTELVSAAQQLQGPAPVRYLCPCCSCQQSVF